MAKKSTSKTGNEPAKLAALIVDKKTFKINLFERIELGKLFFETPIITKEALELKETEFRKWDDYNSELIKQSFNLENNEYKVDYDNCAKWVGFPFLGGVYGPNEQLKDLKDRIKKKVENLEQLRDKIDLLKSEIEVATHTHSGKTRELVATATNTENKQIFIVHGHNDTVKVNVARTLEKLGLTPIILHEQPSEGRTIIEQFEKWSQVEFAVVLLTDDDDGKAKSEMDLKQRARQNVILELGYFFGKLGRRRVVSLYSKGVELPSDLYGLVYVQIDSTDSWKFALVKELRAAGYTVDANKII